MLYGPERKIKMVEIKSPHGFGTFEERLNKANSNLSSKYHNELGSMFAKDMSVLG